MSEHTKRYGSLVNISVSLKEIVHRLYKNQVLHINKKNVELDFIKREILYKVLGNYWIISNYCTIIY